MGKWLISKPYLIIFYPLRIENYPEYLDRVELDIHYPTGMAITNEEQEVKELLGL